MKRIMIFLSMMIASSLSHGQWEPDIRLTSDPALSQTSLNNAWCIASSGDTVHVVWYDGRNGNMEIYYKRSVDAGNTWGTDTRLTNNSGISWCPSITLSGNVVYLVFEDYRNGINNGEIYFKRSHDGGTSWEPDMRLTNNPAGSMLPSIAVSGSIVHITWQDERDNLQGDIFYKRSVDGGNTWSADTNLSSEPEYSGIPSIATWGDNVHVVWEDNRNNNIGSIYYKRSADGGLTWGPDTRLTTASNDVWDPAIAVNDTILHVVFHDEGTRDIYYKRSGDNGYTWDVIKRLTNTGGYSRYSNIAVSGSCVHVAWEDQRDGNFEIYYMRSLDGGITWEPETRLTNALYNSVQASVAVSDSVVHLIWYDKRDFNDEIYYKRNPTGNFPVSTGTIEQNIVSNPIVIYPNPASSRLNVNFQSPGISTVGVRLFDMRGLIVMTMDFHASEGDNHLSLNLCGIRNGMYYLELTSKAQRYFRKVVIAQ